MGGVVRWRRDGRRVKADSTMALCPLPGASGDSASTVSATSFL